MTEHDAHGRRPIDGYVAPPPPPQIGRGDQPVGRTARFVEAVRRAHGDAFVKSYLTGLTCQFEDCVVWTIADGRKAINKLCGAQIKAERVVIKSDDRAREHFRKQTASLVNRK